MKNGIDSFNKLIGRSKRGEAAVSNDDQPAVSSNYVFCSISHAGNVREKNEDSILASQSTIFYSGKDIKYLYASVADGLGGLKNGEKASYIATTRAFAYFMENISFLGDGVEPHRLLEKAMKNASSAIDEINCKKEKHDMMASTLTIGLIFKDTVYYSHSGDCRIIKFGQKMDFINKSHRVPKGNQIYSCLGIEKEFEMDSGSFPIEKGQSILICSDGLTDMLDDAVIKNIVKTNQSDPEIVCNNLLNEALKNGGRDNISIIYIHRKS